MKKFLLGFFIIFAFKNVDATEGRIYFLGQPRSGNHFASYVISRILNIPCISHPNTGPFLWLSNEWKDTIDVKNPYQQKCFFHGHNPFDLNLSVADKSKDYLIFILRDYKENFMSLAYDKEDIAMMSLKNELLDIKDPYEAKVNSYINNITCFDKWDENKRFLIYYEDLIKNPEKPIMELCYFFDIDPQRAVKFLKDFEEHQKQCFDMSFGKKRDYNDLKRHSEKMNGQNIEEMDNFFCKNFPEHWEKYLKRYKEKY